MVARRILLTVGIVLLLSTLLSAMMRRDEEATAPLRTTVVDPPREVTGSMPGKEPVTAEAGDLVMIRVNSPTSDVAEIPALGIRSFVDPDVPAELQVVGATPGRYPVRLQVSDREVGILLVNP